MISVSVFCPLYFCLQFVSFCLHAVIGDNSETEWRQKGDRKMSMISHERFIGETFIYNSFHATHVFSVWQHAQKADRLSEYVMPL